MSDGQGSQPMILTKVFWEVRNLLIRIIFKNQS